jgi:hypothetical protein
MKTHLNDIDPLPAFKAPDWQEFLVGYGDLPESERQKKEWRDATNRADGEDWRPTETKGIERNGKGQFRTVDYKPPEPPETDIPIPCVVEIGDRIKELARLIGGAWAEPQTQAASQMEQQFFPLYGSGVVGWVTWQAVYPAGLKQEAPVGKSIRLQLPKGFNAICSDLTGDLTILSVEQAARQMERELPGDRLQDWYPGGWIPHTPGDPVPCDPELMVDVRFDDGGESGEAQQASFWAEGPEDNWRGRWDTGEPLESDQITAWRPAVKTLYNKP